jgi:DNA repair protein RadC
MEQPMNLDVLNTVAEIELVYRSKVKPSERPRITSTKEAYQILLQTWDVNKIEFVEQFKVVLINRAHRVLGIYELSSGGIAGTLANPKLVFRYRRLVIPLFHTLGNGKTE